MNITKASPKDEVISCPVELVDQQDAEIKNLKQQQSEGFHLVVSI